LLRTAHSVAEEVAVYPAMAANHEVGQAELAYQEQAAAKMEMGLLERLDPESQDFHDKLGLSNKKQRVAGRCAFRTESYRSQFAHRRSQRLVSNPRQSGFATPSFSALATIISSAVFVI
jgi:hypothetical protein